MNRYRFISEVKGTQKAFRRFLVALCCGDSQLADDIAQESYLKAYMSCESVSDAGKFKAWLFKIGYNTFLDSKRRRPVITADYEEAAQIASNHSTDGSFQYQELYRALDLLPDKERLSILLFYMEGYAIKEISEITGATPDSVKQSLSRGRYHLRRLLTHNPTR